MRWLALFLVLLSGPALAQQRPTPKGGMPSNPVPAYANPAPLVQQTPSEAGPLKAPDATPPFVGPLTDVEKSLIINALERLAAEIKDEHTIKAVKDDEIALGANWAVALTDVKLLPVIGLALSRATNVEIDRIDEHGVNVIDNAASRAASKPYCDLLKKLNSKAGCTIW